MKKKKKATVRRKITTMMEVTKGVGGKKYSQTTVRMPPYVHKGLTKESQAMGVSINTLIVRACMASLK